MMKSAKTGLRNRIWAVTVLLGLAVSACLPASAVESNPVPTLESEGQALGGLDLPGDFLSDESVLVSIYEKINPGVVAIITYASGKPSGQGSGFVVDKEGHILTNYHVIENAELLEVAFPSGYRAEGQVIGTDLDSDIAVVKVDAPADELVPLPLGESAQVKVGQTVIAIGNPYGLSGTMTVGIVSARGRLLESMRSAPGGFYFSAADLIQTDAAINPGNSGGPLLNLKGEVIGINRAIRTNSGEGSSVLSNTGIGFAVPIDIARRVTPYLIREGSYDYPYLGIVSREDLTLAERQALDLPAGVLGAYVLSVTDGSPAARAGVRGGSQTTSIADLQAGGDLITAVDDQPIRTFNDLLNYLVTYKSPGEEVNLSVLRGDQRLTIQVELIARPQ